LMMRDSSAAAFFCGRAIQEAARGHRRDLTVSAGPYGATRRRSAMQ
jgi:hypothetical protein